MYTSGSEANDAVTAALARVKQIDLTPINRILQYENPALWTRMTVVETESAYRHFLALNLLFPSTTFAVNRIVDEYWHQHILDTLKYAADCEMVFGHLLHHYPYFGIEGEEDRRQKLEAFVFTQRIWEEVFGTPMIGTAKLTLDKVLGGYQSEIDGIAKQDVYVAPQSCKNGQHCQKVIVPGDFDPEEPLVVAFRTASQQ